MTAIEAQVDEAAGGVRGGDIGHGGNVSRLLHREPNAALRQVRFDPSGEPGTVAPF